MRSLGTQILRALVGTVALLAFAVCAAVVVKLTLTPSPASVGIAHTNLHPGKSIRLYLNQPSVHQAILQIGGNILIGVPFGLLLPMITPRARGLLRVLLTTLFVVLVLELAQHYFIEGRSFDVDDLILAAIGAVIGYVPVGRYLSLRVHPGHRHWWQRLLGRRPPRRRLPKPRRRSPA
ncbi:VanZ family protein [Streptacidiphilus sp. N1-12]|uniref:VanZ family protein n=2 Tax=Streptacidiphilus alkalitolerans TaxID=3342712 RepID=A0ABV6WHW2_9ACTN